MFEELNKLILFLQSRYENITKQWKESNQYIKINLKKNLVKDIKEKDEIFNYILNYRNYLNKYNIENKLYNKNFKFKNIINTRVKSLNWIEYKINNYIENHENGEIPIIKCFNDIYGIRIIFNEDVNYNEIKKFIKQEYKGKIKCIDSSKEEGYIATHLYFNNDNFNFPWELQIWDKKHEISNIISHEKYKQEYTKWEGNNKWGEEYVYTLYIIK